VPHTTDMRAHTPFRTVGKEREKALLFSVFFFFPCWEAMVNGPWRCPCGNVVVHAQPPGLAAKGSDASQACQGGGDREGGTVDVGPGTSAVAAAASWLACSAEAARVVCDAATANLVAQRLVDLVSAPPQASNRTREFQRATCGGEGAGDDGDNRVGAGEGRGSGGGGVDPCSVGTDCRGPTSGGVVFVECPLAVSARCGALLHRGVVSMQGLGQLLPHLTLQRVTCANCEAGVGVEVSWEEGREGDVVDVLAAPGQWSILLSASATTALPLPLPVGAALPEQAAAGHVATYSQAFGFWVLVPEPFAPHAAPSPSPSTPTTPTTVWAEVRSVARRLVAAFPPPPLT
jgi:hypothetical protein